MSDLAGNPEDRFSHNEAHYNHDHLDLQVGKSFAMQTADQTKYSKTCVKRPYTTIHILGFSDRWLLIAA